MVVLPEMHVNFPIFISVEMYFKLNFERVVAQLKDVVIFLRSVCWAYVWSYSVVKLLL